MEQGLQSRPLGTDPEFLSLSKEEMKKSSAFAAFFGENTDERKQPENESAGERFPSKGRRKTGRDDGYEEDIRKIFRFI